jgi:invasion protein IalB
MLMSFLLKRISAVVLVSSLAVTPFAAYAQTAEPAEAPAAAPAAPAAAPAPAPAAKPAASAPKAAAPAKPAAQPAPQAAPAAPQGQSSRVELQPAQADWTKVCGKDPSTQKEICYTTRDFSASPDQPPVLAMAVYDVKGDDTKIFRLLMPVALLLRPGFRFTIDKSAPIEGGFEICFPNGCFAEAKVKMATIDAMKKGTTLNISVKNQVNAEVTFSLPLAGFGKAFDGAAIDPKVLEDQQRQLQDEMRKRAEEERKRLESEQGKAGAPAPAPAAPAAPAK